MLLLAPLISDMDLATLGKQFISSFLHSHKSHKPVIDTKAHFESKPETKSNFEIESKTALIHNLNNQDKNYALVIGARKDNPNDVRRFDQYFSGQNIEWRGLKGHLNPPKLTPETSAETMFDKTLVSTDKHYKDFLKNEDFKSPFNKIIIDRATIQGILNAENPYFGVDKNQPNGPALLEAFNNFYSKKFFSTSNNSGDITGSLQQSMHMLFLIHLVDCLQPNGSLIFDAQRYAPEYIALLEKYFNKKPETWDYHCTKNKILDFKEVYDGGMHGNPKFIEFKGRNNQKINHTELKKNLKELSLSVFNSPSNSASTSSSSSKSSDSKKP